MWLPMIEQSAYDRHMDIQTSDPAGLVPVARGFLHYSSCRFA